MLIYAKMSKNIIFARFAHLISVLALDYTDNYQAKHIFNF